jgi:formylglycine-generating enzyme required for sulfatase activity
MAPVASYPPNKFGVSDLLGNTWEWVNDCGGNESLADYPRDGLTMPKEGGDCPRTRGGSSLSPPYWMTVTIRGGDHKPETRLNVMGFRVVSNAP